ncbi:hypothetical protein AVEN_113117-1 [Araneus ventricosus]|uniref:Uncharacterized protein n=1 Tax=Araneus ventricosus TaxID=182803 RepID=A0A4Y2NYQ9_ARAVE|nr:hypothetical protein AVEN_113117-1 [Araneus ventricosus]
MIPVSASYWNRYHTGSSVIPEPVFHIPDSVSYCNRYHTGTGVSLAGIRFQYDTGSDGRYVSAPEAMWRLNEFSLSEKSHVDNHEIGRSLAKPTASGKTKW